MMKKSFKIILLSFVVMLIQPVSFALATDLQAALDECSKITSALERLNCFDKIANTPSIIPATDTGITTNTFRNAAIVDRVLKNEESRPKDNLLFLASETPEHDPEGNETGIEMIISAPSRGGNAIQGYLAVSCILNITRLQLITLRPIDKQSIRIQLLLDGRPIGPLTSWQVLESGQVVDAGRGLVAINLLRGLGAGYSLSIKSDDPMFDGMYFDAAGLSEHIRRERQVCHW